MDLKVYRWVRAVFFAIAVAVTLIIFPVHFIFDNFFPIYVDCDIAYVLF